MNLKTQIFFVFFVIPSPFLLSAHAQPLIITQSPKPSASPGATPAPTPPPDLRAYDEARRIKDPQKKIEALERLIKDFPLPDPMTNPATVDRGKYYGVPGTPTPVIDGLKLPSSGGPREMAKNFFDRVNPKIETELESPAQAQIALSATVADDVVKANVVVDQVKTASSDLRLQLALTEDQIRYTGENGIRFHPMVVRSLGGKESKGFVLATSGPTTIDWTFDVKAMSDELKKYLDDYERQGHRGDTFTFSDKKYQIISNNLSLVAFVQDMKTKTVLQTVSLKLNPSSSVSATAAAQ